MPATKKRTQKQGYDKGSTDYFEITPPEDVNEEDYSAKERRAALLKTISDKGHIDLSLTKQGDRFGVQHNQIHQDLKKLRKFIVEHDYQDEIRSESKVMLLSAARRLMEKGEEERASRVVMRMNKFANMRGIDEDRREDDGDRFLDDPEIIDNLTETVDAFVNDAEASDEDEDQSDFEVKEPRDEKEVLQEEDQEEEKQKVEA